MRHVERHPHTRVVPGSAADLDRDATVAWNHIDFRFRSEQPLLLSVEVTDSTLEVSLWSSQPVSRSKTPPKVLRMRIDPDAHSCGTCERSECILFDSEKR
ncbi:MAG TPA: VanW family protein [Fimbriimonas sp.]|nr:VanW family protein [Fimbriimonas sp.]